MRKSMKGSIEMEPTSCAICDSPIRAEIERNDALWKDIETIKWARERGLNISKFSLAKHRANHLQPTPASDNGNGKKDKAPETQTMDTVPLSVLTIDPKKTVKGNGKKPAKIHPQMDKPDNIKQAKADDVADAAKAKIPIMVPTVITDQLLLDTVRDRVYQKLLDGEIELDLGDGFKAIEIKHKIAEESQNEKLLLEILNEIRAEELKGVMASHDTQ